MGPANAPMLFLADDLRDVFVTPLEMAEALSETMTVTRSPTSLARKSRVTSARRPEGEKSDPGEDPNCAKRAACTATTSGFIAVPTPFLWIARGRARGGR